MMRGQSLGHMIILMVVYAGGCGRTGYYIYVYSTNCDVVTHCLCSTEPKCLHLDEVKYKYILLEKGTFEAVSRHPWPCLVTMEYLVLLRYPMT